MLVLVLVLSCFVPWCLSVFLLHGLVLHVLALVLVLHAFALMLHAPLNLLALVLRGRACACDHARAVCAYFCVVLLPFSMIVLVLVFVLLFDAFCCW